MTGLAAPGVERRQRREEAALRAEVPLAADLLAMALVAGLTPYLALELVSRCGPHRFAERISAVLAADGRLVDGLEAEADARPVLGDLLRLLVACERWGAPAAPGLSRLAADERARMRQQALARARAVPVKLLFPLVFLVLPAFLVLTVAPVLLAGFTH